jgi:TonB family protein
MAIAPDSGGTDVWLLSGGGGQPTPSRFFTASLDPRRTTPWIASVRAFLAAQLTDADSGAIRSSPVLLDMEGSSIYAARRRVKGTWSDEHILVMEGASATEPIMVIGDARSIREIIDSLESVSLRTYLDDSVIRRDSIDRANLHKPQKLASASPRNRPPPYPDRMRRLGIEGTVLLSFDIGVDGKADMQTIKVIHSPGPEFTESVTKSLRGFRFTAAIRDGAPARTRVVMPFTFALLHR